MEPTARSRMNVVFRIKNYDELEKNDDELEKKFVKEADEMGYLHVKGHR